MMAQICEWAFDGIPLKTGDLICTKVGNCRGSDGVVSFFIGMAIPGECDHVAIYTGPSGRFIEARPRGVGTTVMGARWEAHEKFAERGFIDSFLGGVSPLAAKNLSPEQERNYRLAVAAYCEAQVGKPYNFNFPDPETEERFYCSQLAYRAYLTVGINLNTGLNNRPPYLPDSIVFPEEIWQSQPHI